MATVGWQTCAVEDVEAFALDGCIWAERHVEATALSDHGVRPRSCGTAESTNQRRRSIIAVVNLNSIVGALEVSLQLKVGESLHENPAQFCNRDINKHNTLNIGLHSTV